MMHVSGDADGLPLEGLRQQVERHAHLDDVRRGGRPLRVLKPLIRGPLPRSSSRL